MQWFLVNKVYILGLIVNRYWSSTTLTFLSRDFAIYLDVFMLVLIFGRCCFQLYLNKFIKILHKFRSQIFLLFYYLSHLIHKFVWSYYFIYKNHFQETKGPSESTENDLKLAIDESSTEDSSMQVKLLLFVHKTTILWNSN